MSGVNPTPDEEQENPHRSGWNHGDAEYRLQRAERETAMNLKPVPRMY